jgi:hypothetical protein
LSQSEPSKRASRGREAQAISFFGAMIAAYAITSAFRSGGWQLVYALGALGIAYFLATFAHECGHALAALLCGRRLIVFAVWPFGFQVPNRNLVLVSRRYNDGAGGWVASVPRRAGEEGKAVFAFILLAGPAASALLAIVALCQSVTDLPPLAGTAVRLPNLWFALAVLALQDVVLSLRSSGDDWTPSDGDQLKSLWQSDREQFRLYRPWSWISMIVALKVQLRDVPEWMMAEARQSAAQSDYVAQYVAGVEVGRLLDAPPVDPVAARALLDDYRARYGASDWLVSCDAYCAIIWEADPARAEAALAEIEPPAPVPPMRFAAEAALAAWLGDAGTVTVKLADMRKALKANSPFRDDTFRVIEGQIEDRLAQTLAASPARP